MQPCNPFAVSVLPGMDSMGPIRAMDKDTCTQAQAWVQSLDITQSSFREQTWAQLGQLDPKGVATILL
jgi:hypothetical protein